ncbi:MAG: hypothetical protein LBK56_11335 [Gracilibacteraceae bacterium]|nr:hypothetical protein [Gracilibacteraceae bacterium]
MKLSLSAVIILVFAIFTLAALNAGDSFVSEMEKVGASNSFAQITDLEADMDEIAGYIDEIYVDSTSNGNMVGKVCVTTAIEIEPENLYHPPRSSLFSAHRNRLLYCR